jgi:mevalonate pyrophosphate decarboxylase
VKGRFSERSESILLTESISLTTTSERSLTVLTVNDRESKSSAIFDGSRPVTIQSSTI